MNTLCIRTGKRLKRPQRTSTDYGEGTFRNERLYGGGELHASKLATTTGQTDKDPNNTDEVSLYPYKLPQKNPPPSPTPTQPNPSSTPPAPTKSSHPSNSQREAKHCNPQKPLRKTLQATNHQLRNSH